MKTACTFFSITAQAAIAVPILVRDSSAKTDARARVREDGSRDAVLEDSALTCNATMRGSIAACAYRFNAPEVIS